MSDKVLIVDDDLVSLTAYKTILQEEFVVESAHSPAQALTKLRREPYAVVIADMVMTDMDGITFLDKVAKASPATLRMILTGHARLETAMTAVNQGHVFGFFSKSCDPDELIAGVRKALDRYHAERRKFRPSTTAEVLSAEEIEFLTKL